MVLHDITLSFCVIAGTCIFCQWLAWWIELPPIILLLPAGLLLGPLTGYLKPDELFGHLLFPLISLSVAIILFEGSLTLRFNDVIESKSVIRNLITLGYAITVMLTALIACLIFHMPWQLALLFGAITSIGGPTVISPMLRSIRLKQPLSHILRWEGILIDPIGAVISILIFGIATASLGNESVRVELLHFIESITSGTLAGFVFAYLFAYLLKHQWLPKYLHNVGCLALVFIVFTIASQINEGGGLLAVTTMGICLANMKDTHIEDILNFKESLSLLLISGLFVLLAARVNISEAKPVLISSAILFLLAQFVIRPISVICSTFKSELNLRQKIILSLICPRGIVCAAMASLFSLQLHISGYQQAQPFTVLTFMLILSTVIFQSISAPILTRQLGLKESSPQGIIIIGANAFARALAQALKTNSVKYLLIDSNWGNIAKARISGLSTLYGDPLSIDTTRQIPLQRYQLLLALRPRHEFNQLACLHYRHEITSHCYLLMPSTASASLSKSSGPIQQKKHLFNPSINFAQLEQYIQAKATIKTTLLSEKYTIDHQRKGNKGIQLLAIDPKGHIHIYCNQQKPMPTTGWKILTLNPLEEEKIHEQSVKKD